MRLIDAEKYREEWLKFRTFEPMLLLDQQPTVEAVPVIHAKWDKGYTFPDGAYWKCTNCGELIKVKVPMHYCNNCGAKMDGGEKPSLQRRGRMTREEAKSCIGTIEMLQRLAYNVHGIMDVIDADNCKKIIKALEQEPKIVPVAEIKIDQDKLKELVDKAVLTVTSQEPVIDKIESIVAKWKMDTWTDNLSYECMFRIAEIIDKYNGEEPET